MINRLYLKSFPKPCEGGYKDYHRVVWQDCSDSNCSKQTKDSEEDLCLTACREDKVGSCESNGIIYRFKIGEPARRGITQLKYKLQYIKDGVWTDISEGEKEITTDPKVENFYSEVTIEIGDKYSNGLNTYRMLFKFSNSDNWKKADKLLKCNRLVKTPIRYTLDFNIPAYNMEGTNVRLNYIEGVSSNFSITNSNIGDLNYFRNLVNHSTSKWVLEYKDVETNAEWKELNQHVVMSYFSVNGFGTFYDFGNSLVQFFKSLGLKKIKMRIKYYIKYAYPHLEDEIQYTNEIQLNILSFKPTLEIIESGVSKIEATPQSDYSIVLKSNLDPTFPLEEIIENVTFRIESIGDDYTLTILELLNKDPKEVTQAVLNKTLCSEEPSLNEFGGELKVKFKNDKIAKTYRLNHVKTHLIVSYRGKEGSEECKENILNDGTYSYVYKTREKLINGILCSEENNIEDNVYVTGGNSRDICNSAFVPNFDYMLVNFEYNTDDGVTMGVPKYRNKEDLDPALIFDNPINSFTLKGGSELNSFLSTDNRKEKVINILADGSIGCGQENNNSLQRVNKIGDPYPDNFVYPNTSDIIEDSEVTDNLIKYNIIYIQSMGDDVWVHPQSENFIINFKLILGRLNFIKERYKIVKADDKIRIKLLAGWCQNNSDDNRFIMNIKAYKGGTFRKHPDYDAILENNGGIERPIDKWISEAPKNGCCGNTESKREIAVIEYNIITKSARIIKK